jgi:DNA helicase HerA-like ATPase
VDQPLNLSHNKGILGDFVGTVYEVGAASVKLSLSSSTPANANVEVNAHVGDYVCVEGLGIILLGQVSEATASDPTYGVVASVTLLATFEQKNFLITPGVLRAPTLGAKVFVAPDELVKRLVEGRFSIDETKEHLSLEIAKLAHGSEVTLSVAPEKLFGRHCAVVGTSGGGKSWTVARLVEQCAAANSKVIVFDATGEYHPMEGSVLHVHIGEDPEPRPGAREVAVPFYHLTEGDLFAIFKPSGQSQAPKLRAAMKSLKLARLAPQLSVQGLIMKADKPKMQFEREYSAHYDELERPYADFDIRKLTRQIENECVNFQRSPVEPNVWGGMNGSDLSMCVPLINRIQDIIGSKNLAAIFNPEERPSLFREINSFLNDPQHTVLRISLKYLSFEHNTREIVANAVARYLLALSRKSTFRTRPLVLFIDEAHQFLDASIRDGEAFYKLDAFSSIAKEGRKYALTLCIATQRPRDIPEGVLSQMGTMLVHRLINQHDREVVEKASAGFDSYSSAAIPTLASGEAVLLGVDFPLPLFVRVIPPINKPDSKGPDYQTFWGHH